MVKYRLNAVQCNAVHWLDLCRLGKSWSWGRSTQFQPSIPGVRKELLLFYICISVHLCPCTWVYLCICICTFIHLMWDKRPCCDDPLNITPRWARRKLTTGQQSHRRSSPMFMFNPDPTSNVQMCNAAIPRLWLRCANFVPPLLPWASVGPAQEWSNERSNEPTSDQICN